MAGACDSALRRRRRAARAPADVPSARRPPRQARSPSRAASRRSVAQAASRTRPSVSVPVLSRTTCVTRASVSSASLRASTTPERASEPAAAASAAGVASDSAHGHETTSSATVTGKRARRIELPPDDRRRQRKQQQAADEPRGDAIGESRDGAGVRRRALDQAQHRGQARRLAGGAHAHHQRAVAVERTRQARRRPWPARCGRALAGQHRFLDMRAAVDDLSIGRHDGARTHEHDVAGGKLRGRDDRRVSHRRAIRRRRSAIAGRCRATTSIAAPAFCRATSSP